MRLRNPKEAGSGSAFANFLKKPPVGNSIETGWQPKNDAFQYHDIPQTVRLQSQKTTIISHTTKLKERHKSFNCFLRS